MNREELAWAAGLVDGEGCFSAHSSGPNGSSMAYPRITITQTYNPEVLHRFRRVIGFGHVQGPHRPHPKSRGEVWVYRISGFEPTQAIVAMLWAFLSGPKREQARRVLRNFIEADHASGRRRMASRWKRTI